MMQDAMIRLDRRTVLKSAGAAVLGFRCGGSGPTEVSTRGPLWISGVQLPSGEHGLAAFDPRRGTRVVVTPFRGHGVTPVGPDRVVLVARRPGRELAIVDLEAGRVAAVLELPDGRVLGGHAAVDPMGHLLTTEADVDTGRGWLGVWDLERRTRIGQLETSGRGPHELAVVPGRGTVVVANGGYFTGPDGRERGFEDMQPTLVEIDPWRGEPIRLHRFPEPKASVRHLAVDDEGWVAVGLQLLRTQVGHDRPVPLCGLIPPGEEIRWLDRGLAEAVALDDYVGSVAVSAVDRVVGFSSPRGDVSLFFDRDDGRFLAADRRVDVCGLAPLPDGGFATSSATGQLARLGPGGELDRTWTEELRFDNHMVVLGNHGGEG